MDARFQEIFPEQENEIFRVVFFPDRIYHAQYLNASISDRYRYDVDEVRNKSGFNVLKGTVFIDNDQLAFFLRIEYRPTRLLEQIREKGRVLSDKLFVNIKLENNIREQPPTEAKVVMTYCAMIDAYQVEIWQTTQLPARRTHDIRVINLMGADGEIITHPTLSPFLKDIETIRRVHLSATEYCVVKPLGHAINDPVTDNNFERSIQVPNSPTPSDNKANTIQVDEYVVDFQRGFFLQADEVAPVKYRNPMMNDNDPERADNDIVAMRWLLQQELGGNLVFFHEVTIPPGVIEGTHHHIGSEEIYYVVRGEGIAYMGHKDDPGLLKMPIVERSIYGLDHYNCREIPVRPGSVIFTKSGGIHGIRNNSQADLVFVAFLYQGS